MKLHIANKNYSSWSLRPWVLMTALGVHFDEVVSPFEGGSGSGWTQFRSFSPTGKVPCLVDGAQVVWDSLAIAEYLAENHPGVWPADRAARAWARSATAEMHSGFGVLRNTCPMSVGVRVRLHGIGSALQADLDRLSELWLDGLQRFGGPYLAGSEFTAVDAFFCPVAFRIQTYGLPMPAAAMAYVNHLLELPAMQQWTREALAEPWIEPSHEADCLKDGVLLEDLRRPGL
jgi:glutathione S-transferase